MALQAQCVHIAAIQQTRIGRTVREMTECATFSLNGRMLIDKRTGNLGVTFHADRVSVNTAAQLLLLKRSVRIMTAAATNQPFVHLVMKGLCKGRLDIGVAGVTELGLRNLEQPLFALKRMDAMTTRTPHVRLPVRGTIKIRVRSCMAGKAFPIHNLRGSLAELEDLGGVAPRLHMLLTRPMAGLAGNPFTLVHQREFPVRIVGELLYSFRVAGLANL